MNGSMQQFPLTLDHALRRAERIFADRAIVSCGHAGRERTTYRDWTARTRRVAGALDRLGVSADGRVGTFAWNTSRHLQLYFAVPCSGRVLHTLNIRLFAEQIVYVVNHAEDELVFVDRSLLSLLWPLVDELKTVRHVVVMDDGAGDPVPDDPRILDYETLLADAEPVEPVAIEDENRAAAMCYTTGTTGEPKGVVYSHRSIMLHALGTMTVDSFGLSERDVVLPVVPMFHANAWGLVHAAPLTGASLVLPGRDLSPGAIARLIEQERVTLAAGVPTIWMGVLGELADRDVSSLSRIVCGGSAVSKSLSEAYRERTGLPLLQAWGMTETSPVGSVARIKSTLANRPEEELVDLRASVGLPVSLVECRIVEPDGDRELPWDGEAQGELQVRGPWVAAGYYRDPAGADAFTPDGWLRTGDIGVIDTQGYIRLVDRTKDLIKSGGEWISSVALENEIMAHDDVAEAAVVGVPDDRWGERPLACVVAAPGAELTADDVRAHLEKKVADWWIPERVEFLDELPKTSVGKFSKRTLRERYAGASPLPDENP